MHWHSETHKYHSLNDKFRSQMRYSLIQPKYTPMSSHASAALTNEKPITDNQKDIQI